MEQREINELYKKEWLTIRDIAEVTGLYRQGIWEGITKRKTFNGKRNKKGEWVVHVDEVKAYVIRRREELLATLAGYKLPIEE